MNTSDRAVLAEYLAAQSSRRSRGLVGVAIGIALMLFAGYMISLHLESARAHDAVLASLIELDPKGVQELAVHSRSARISLSIAIGVANGLVGFLILLTSVIVLVRPPSGKVLQILAKRAVSS